MLITSIGVARIFSVAVHFLDQTTDDPFFSRHPLLHGHMRLIYTASNYLFISSVGCTSPNSAPFLPHFNKNLEKFFFIALGGAPAPPAPPLAMPMITSQQGCIANTAMVIYQVRHKSLNKQPQRMQQL